MGMTVNGAWPFEQTLNPISTQGLNMVHITSHVTEKMQFNDFPIISQWDLLVAIANKQNKQITIILAIFKSPNPSNILT